MKKVKKVEVDEIYIKYENLINQAKSNYIQKIEYSEVMEILRYCEKILNKTIPINVSCSNCVLDLVLLFSRLKNK